MSLPRNATTTLLFIAMNVNPNEELMQRRKLQELQDKKMQKSAEKNESIQRNREIKKEVKQNHHHENSIPKHSYARETKHSPAKRGR
jgi:hypothetical protein